MELNAVQKQWLEALRSGKYEQGKHYLKSKAENSEKYCCLGVLAEDVYKIPFVPVSSLQDFQWLDSIGVDESVFGFSINDGSFFNTLPPFMYDDTSINSIVGILIDMNDSGKSFEEIADYLEETWNSV